MGIKLWSGAHNTYISCCGSPCLLSFFKHLFQAIVIVSPAYTCLLYIYVTAERKFGASIKKSILCYRQLVTTVTCLEKCDDYTKWSADPWSTRYCGIKPTSTSIPVFAQTQSTALYWMGSGIHNGRWLWTRKFLNIIWKINIQPHSTYLSTLKISKVGLCTERFYAIILTLFLQTQQIYAARS